MQAETSEAAVFVTPEEISVKPPVLRALIQLRSSLSPYEIDAERTKTLNLRDVLKQVAGENLSIKISHADAESSKWTFRSSLGNFLPTITNQYNYQYIQGKYASPFGLLTNVNSPYMTIPSGLNWTFFSGGANLFTARQTLHQWKASRFALDRTANDILLEAAHLYYQLALQDVVLQIRIKALETSKTLCDKNRIQFNNGAITKLDLLQAQTQLARDRQALIAQQVARRKAAVDLSTLLNLDCAEDIVLKERSIRKLRLVDDDLRITELVQIAIDSRPELKKWEQERLAAKDAIKVAFSPLVPHVSGQAALATTGALVARASNNAASSAAGTGPFGIGSFSSSSVSSIGNTGNRRRFNLAEIYMIGLSVQWNIGGMGLSDAARVQAARWQARKAQLEFARELTRVCQEVRDSYLESLSAENLIIATTDAVVSSEEQLQVATSRFREGVGTDLELVVAQRDYTEALISKANAIIGFNESQAKLLRALGKISVDTLSSKKVLTR